MLIFWLLAAGSFNLAEDMKPRVINLDFPALPAGAGRSQRLVENGILFPTTIQDQTLIKPNRFLFGLCA